MLARFRQQYLDRVPYVVPIASLLQPGERAITVERVESSRPSVLFAALVLNFFGTEVRFTVSGGLPGWIYPVGLRFTTDIGRSFVALVQIQIDALPSLLGPPIVPPEPLPDPLPGVGVDAGQFTEDNNTGQCPT